MKSKKFLALVLSVFGLTVYTTTASAANLTGKVNFEGVAPAKTTLKLDSDPKCKMMHSNGLESDEVIVNANNTLKNTFVYLKEGVTSKHEAPKEVVKFDQLGCAYSPKVFGIQVGQPLEIINSDDTLHNVHSLATQSPQFNLGMPVKGMKLKKTFAKPEVMVKIKCDVHPWMAAYAGVLEHPFYSVTGEDGSFTIQNVPAGEYVLEAWHEKFGVVQQKITVADQDIAQDFSFKA